MVAVEIPVVLITALRAAADRKVELEKLIENLRGSIETIMTEAGAEYATCDGDQVIHWSHVSSRRLDQAKLKQMVDPAVLASCYTENQSRRFNVLKGGQ